MSAPHAPAPAHHPAPFANTPPTSVRSRRRIALYLAMPKVAIALLVLSVIGLLWMFQRNEQEEQRATLIADILWLEQNIRFHLTSTSEQLTQLGQDLGPAEAGSENTFRVRARHLTKTDPELQQIRWLDSRGAQRHGHPARVDLTPDLAAFGEESRQQIFDTARRLAKPVYSPPYRLPSGEARFDLMVPVFADGQFAGMLAASYSLNGLINQMVPWWLAEKYQLRILDDAGVTLARKSNVVGEAIINSYTIPLDPPGHGITLQADAYRIEGNPAQRALAAAIIVLALGIFWSLWALRAHVRRRLSVEQALREANAVRKAMEDSLITGLRARDLDGRITYVNPAFCRMTGFAAEELVGHLPPMPYWAPDEIEQIFQMHQVVMAGGAPAEGFEMRFRRKSGEHFDDLIYEAPLIDSEGLQIGWMGSVLDITERKRAEEFARQQQEKLQHTARLVSMGEMVSTLAHELNQPLAALSSYTTGCINRIEAGPVAPGDFADVLKKMSAQAQRAGRIIRQVHDFVKKREPRREACAIPEVVDDSIALFEADAKKRGIRIERLYQGGLPEVSADPHMIGQVLFNLIRNAADAMATTPAAERRLSISVSRAESQIVVRLCDRGPGVPPDSAEKLFTPFFSTKAEGMGMGLSICRSIVEFHAGRLWVEANPQGGACFIFSLPIPGAHS